MTYVKKGLTEEVKDTLRINLSVYEPKLSPEPVCDFCGSKHPESFYAASRMSTGEKRNCWRWLACHECSTAIDADKWDTVERRLANALSKSLPSSLRKRAAHESLKGFHACAIRDE